MIIDRYITTEILGSLATSLLLLAVIFAGYSAAVYMADAADGLLPLATVVRLIMLKTLIALEILLPTAFYFSVLSALGRLHRDSEVAALNAAGIGELRVMGSVFKFAIVIGILVGLMSMHGRPWAYRESYRLEAAGAAAFDINNIKAGQFLQLYGTSYVLFAREINADHNGLREVFLKSGLVDHNRIIFARDAYLPPPRADTQRSVELYNGYAYLLDPRGHEDTTLHFKILVLHLPPHRVEAEYKRKAEPTANLAISEQLKDIAEYQWRLSTPLGTVLLALLAVPLSASKPRQTRFRSVFIATVIYAVSYNLVSLVRNMVEQGRIDVMPGLWLAYVFPACFLAALVFVPRLLHRGQPT